MLDARRVRPDTVTQTALWCGGVPVEELDALDPEKRFPGINVPTSNGARRASNGDFIVRYPSGTFDVFTPGQYSAIQQDYTDSRGNQS